MARPSRLENNKVRLNKALKHYCKVLKIKFSHINLTYTKGLNSKDCFTLSWPSTSIVQLDTPDRPTLNISISWLSKASKANIIKNALKAVITITLYPPVRWTQAKTEIDEVYFNAINGSVFKLWTALYKLTPKPEL